VELKVIVEPEKCFGVSDSRVWRWRWKDGAIKERGIRLAKTDNAVW
jgi:hypothetical protein